jgi:murein DD-endopeptidase MepM/ murein hydrolase activator NlpD
VARRVGRAPREAKDRGRRLDQSRERGAGHQRARERTSRQGLRRHLCLGSRLRGVQPGDEFRILYEQTYAPQGKGRGAASGGPILAAKYHAAAAAAAIYFETEPGRGGYYRPDGTSVQGEFLAAPLNYSRITSSFSPARFHPILRRTRPHMGVDYAAPTGTPIWSVGNGVVSYVGWMSGYGRLVKVRHAGGYESYYSHMSRFANGVRVGQPVRQKQVITSSARAASRRARTPASASPRTASTSIRCACDSRRAAIASRRASG